MKDFVVQAGYTERRPNRGTPLMHAISVEAQLSGLPKPDAECGRLINELIGPWSEAEAVGRVCPRCRKARANMDALDEELLSA